MEKLNWLNSKNNANLAIRRVGYKAGFLCDLSSKASSTLFLNTIDNIVFDEKLLNEIADKTSTTIKSINKEQIEAIYFNKIKSFSEYLDHFNK